MTDRKTPHEFAMFEINQCRADLSQPRDLTADQLFAACTARAQLAVAAALLDVADAIRTAGRDASGAINAAVPSLTGAVRSLGRP